MHSRSTLPLSQQDSVASSRRNLTTLSKLLWRSNQDDVFAQAESSSRSLHLLSTSKSSTMMFNGPSLPGFRYPSPESFNELPHRTARHSRSFNSSVSPARAKPTYAAEQPVVIFFNGPAQPKSRMAARQRQWVSSNRTGTHKSICLLVTQGLAFAQHEVHGLHHQTSWCIGLERCFNVRSSSKRSATALVKSTHR